VVIGMHAESGYPISTEVYELSDDGLHAIGAFQRAPQKEEQANRGVADEQEEP
jgi:hypothetical protein